MNYIHYITPYDIVQHPFEIFYIIYNLYLILDNYNIIIYNKKWIYCFILVHKKIKTKKIKVKKIYKKMQKGIAIKKIICYN